MHMLHEKDQCARLAEAAGSHLVPQGRKKPEDLCKKPQGSRSLEFLRPFLRVPAPR